MSPASTAPLPRTAVLMQMAGMGDLVWHAPYFRAVASSSEDGVVTVIAPPSAQARELLAHEPWVREVIDFDRRPRRSENRRGRHSGVGGLLRMAAELKPRDFDRIVLFTDRASRALVMSVLAGIPQRIGYGTHWLQRVLSTAGQPIERYRGTAVPAYQEASSLCIQHGWCDGPIVPRLTVRADVLPGVRQRLAALSRPAHAFSIGASEAFKQWGAANFADLAQRLMQAGQGVVMLGGPAEKTLAAEILGRLGSDPRDGIIAMTNGTVGETVAALSLVQTCAGNDTGAANIAAAVGTPTFVILGPRPVLAHDPQNLHMLQAAAIGDIRPIDVYRQMLREG